MAVIQQLLQRLGFVKLGRFGLELTPDGRVLSTRPAVLDDGAGGRVVGWEDGDFAASELPSWRPNDAQPARRESVRRLVAPAPELARRLASPAAKPAPPAPPPRRARATAVPPAIPEASKSKPVPVAASAAVMPADVAGEPAVDEDDWEWTIALARARTDEPEPIRPPPPDAAPRTRPMATVAAAIAAPLAAKEPAASAEWPATLPIGAIDYDDYSAVPTRPAIAIPSVARPRPASVMPIATTTPSTVIPVPTLPTVRSTANASRLAPVVRTIPAQPRAEAPRRYPKGTAPQEPATTPSLRAMSEETVPSFSIDDRTRPGVAAPVAPKAAAAPSRDDDRTRPGIALPPAARTVALPSIKRRMSSP